MKRLLIVLLVWSIAATCYGWSTNDYTNEEKQKLEGIESGAQPNPTTATQEEAEAGTETALRSWSPKLIADAIAALAASASSFLGLSDTPASYTGQGGKVVSVKSDESGLEFSDAAAGGTGDVVGPASATDGNLAVFDGVTGKLIKDGGSPFTGLDVPGAETDPVFSAWYATFDPFDTGDETDPVFGAWLIATPPLYVEADPAVGTHESTYDHTLIATALQAETDPDFNAWLIATPPLYSETDPIFASWDKSTGISITESQISDFGIYLTAEVDSSTTNEINTITGDDSNTTLGLGITLAGAGTVATSVSGDTVTITGTGPTVDDTAYDATTWDSNTDAPTKNATRDIIETKRPAFRADEGCIYRGPNAPTAEIIAAYVANGCAEENIIWADTSEESLSARVVLDYADVSALETGVPASAGNRGFFGLTDDDNLYLSNGTSWVPVGLSACNVAPYFAVQPSTQTIGSDSVAISYTSTDPESDNYALYTSIDDGSTYSLESASESPGAHTVTLSGLSVETEYLVKLRLNGLTGLVGPTASNTVTFTTSGTIPTTPSNLSANTYLADGTGFTLSWDASTDPDGTIDHYIVKDDSVAFDSNVASTSLAITGLDAGDNSDWTVIAVDNDTNESSPSAQLSAQMIPAAPTGHSLDAGNALVTLHPGSSTGSSSFKYYLKASGDPTKSSYDATGTATDGASITSLVNGTTYHVGYTGVNATGESVLSSIVTATPTSIIFTETFSDLSAWSATAGRTDSLPTISGGRCLFTGNDVLSCERTFSSTGSLTVQWNAQYSSTISGDFRIYLQTSGSTGVTNNTYLCQVSPSDTKAYLYKYVNGTGTELAAPSLTETTTDDTYQLILNRSTGDITLTRGGTTIASATDNTHTAFTKITIFGAGANSTSVYVDNLSIYAD